MDCASEIAVTSSYDPIRTYIHTYTYLLVRSPAVTAVTATAGTLNGPCEIDIAHT